MNPIPPFVANSDDDMHCVNAVYRMVLKHFLHEDMSWEQIDAVTKTIPGKGVWTVLGDIELARRGVHVSNIEPVDYGLLYSEGPEYLKRVVGEQTAMYYLERTNIASVIPDIPDFLRLVHHETRRVTIQEILTLLKRGNLVGAEINSRILNQKSGFSLHFVLMYDFDGTHIHLHDPGLPPAPSRKVSVADFEKSFHYQGGNGGIEVFQM